MINKDWIFVLDSFALGRAKLEDDPDGWDTQRISIKRSKSFFGLFRSFSVSLRFLGDGYQYVRNVYERNGTEHEIKIAIYEYNEKRDQYLLFYQGVLDLSAYSTEEDIFADVDINDSSFARKIKSRDGTKVTFSRTKSIEGLTLPTNQSVTVQLHEREEKLTGLYGVSEIVNTLDANIGQPNGGIVWPIVKQSSNIDNLIDTPFNQMDSLAAVFWTKADTQATLAINVKVSGTVHSGSDAEGTRTLLLRKYTDDTFANFVDENLFVIPKANFGVTKPFSFDGPIPASFINAIQTNEQMAFVISADNQDFFKATFDEIEISIELNQLFDTTQAQGFLMHESFERIVQVITDKEDSFRSNFFGRIDIGYESDGEGAFQTIHSGAQIRAIPNVNPSESLVSLFKSMNAQRNLGLGIEFNEVNQPFIRVEKKEHFFSGDVIMTIQSVNELTKDFSREWAYNEIEVGYTKSEIEDINGREEYNNKFQWTTFISSFKNKLDLTSTLRADPYGIEKVRQLQWSTNPNEDIKEDNDNFTVVVLPDGENYRNARDENYDLVENIFSPESAYNLDITPGRMLRANGNVIRPGLEKYLDEEIVFGFAEQKEDLKSQKTGEAAITENDNIDVRTLDTGLWFPEIYSFKSVFTREQFTAITRKSGGIVKFSTTDKDSTTKYNYGWILEVDQEGDKEEAEWKLLRVNTSSPNVTLVDPDGNDPNVPIPPVDPSTIIGVFEGGFEFVFSG